MKRVWHIEGYDSLDKIFEADVDVNLIPPCNLTPLLQCLVAKNGLSDEEIVGSFRKEKTRLKLQHLEVTKTDIYGSLSCGDNPHFHATVKDALDAFVQVHWATSIPFGGIPPELLLTSLCAPCVGALARHERGVMGGSSLPL